MIWGYHYLRKPPYINHIKTTLNHAFHLNPKKSTTNDADFAAGQSFLQTLLDLDCSHCHALDPAWGPGACW